MQQARSIRLTSLVFLALAVTLLAIVASGRGSVSGLAYVAGMVILGAASIGGGLVSRRLSMASVLLLAVTAASRVASADGHGAVAMTTGDSGGARWVNRLLDEEDLAVNGARALVWTRFVRDPDVPALAEVMRRAYARMRASVGSVPSPVVATYLGLEEPGQEDTLVIGDVASSAGVVVFLHGYAGSFTLPCWVVAQAARDAGFATVCPATRWIGDWWSEGGTETLRRTLASLKARGVRDVVLAGLSNGGIGATLLATRFRGAFDGVIAISGASSDAAPPGVPVLAIQGERDAQIPASVVRAYAGRVGGRYVSLPAGHFALLMEEARTRAAITSFLAESVARRSGEPARP